MELDVYERLQQHLDRLPMGFPKSRSGVEMELLQKLFDSEEAGMACALDVRPETAEAIAQRLGIDIPTAEERLEKMARKGLLFRSRRDGKTFYSGSAFVVGIYEYQVRKLDRDFAMKKDRYLKEGFYDEYCRGREGHSTFFRVIPVDKSIQPELGAYQYEDVRDIIRQQKTISITDCICRVKAGLLGHPCERPHETCFAFGAGAEFYIENGWGRSVTQDEALEILEMCDREALVLSPSNAQRPAAICACCSCCCDFLHSLKRFDKPSLVTHAAFYAEVDSQNCAGCETCLERCQMEAISMGEAGARINTDRCIGCGLCATTCPEEAIGLKRRKDLEAPPEKMGLLFKKIAAERGKA